MSPRRPPHPSHHGPIGHMYRYETTDLQEFGGIIEEIGEALKGPGSVTISDIDITPVGSQCELTYDRTPHGELVLRLEVKWVPETPSGTGLPSSGKPVIRKR